MSALSRDRQSLNASIDRLLARAAVSPIYAEGRAWVSDRGVLYDLAQLRRIRSGEAAKADDRRTAEREQARMDAAHAALTAAEGPDGEARDDERIEQENELQEAA